MAQFTNQAQLSYNNIVTVSNIAVGEIQDVLSISKTAVKDVYKANDTITYVINIINSGNTELNNLTLTDSLGEYAFGQTKLIPLTYVENTLRYFKNNVLQSQPVVTAENNLVVSGFSVPAGGAVTFVYETRTNQYAPLETESSITNTASLTGNLTSVTTQSVVKASSEPDLSITKSVSPIPVMENGTVTYTFVIMNYGNTPVTQGAVITDVFNPVLNNITASYNDTVWIQGTDFTYDQTTGMFVTLPNKVTVPQAEYSQDEESGIVTVTPGTSTLIIMGTI